MVIISNLYCFIVMGIVWPILAILFLLALLLLDPSRSAGWLYGLPPFMLLLMIPLWRGTYTHMVINNKGFYEKCPLRKTQFYPWDAFKDCGVVAYNDNVRTIFISREKLTLAQKRPDFGRHDSIKWGSEAYQFNFSKRVLRAVRSCAPEELWLMLLKDIDENRYFRLKDLE